MRKRSTPGAWLFFGFVGYPIVSLLNEFLGWLIFLPFLRQIKASPSTFGFGGVGAVILGPPLGIVTAVVSHLIAVEKFGWARIVAVGSGLIGIGGVFTVAPPNVRAYAGDFGFVATPLIWCAALILFGFFARAPKN